MSSPAEIIGAYFLQANLVIPAGAAQTPGDNTTQYFVASLPDQPDQCIVLYDTVGVSWGKRMRFPKTEQYPGVKMLVRTLDYTGFDLINTLAIALDNLYNARVPLGGTTHRVHSVTRSGNIVSLGEERHKLRQLWSLGFAVVFDDSEPSLG